MTRRPRQAGRRNRRGARPAPLSAVFYNKVLIRPMELFFLALLFIFMAAALASGYPVAFALPGAAVLTIVLAAGCGWIFADDASAFFADSGPAQWLSSGVQQSRFFWTPARDTLIAIPLFIFMGVMLQKSRIAEDLLVTMAQLFGSIPGGLGVSVVFVGALLAATTGIVGATVVAMGLIALPAMMRHGYSNRLSTGAIAASGTLGQIIPPSIVLIILADQLSSAADQAQSLREQHYAAVTGERSMPTEFQVVSASAGDMFMGAFLPGLVLVGLYMAYILVFALLNPKKAPAVPYAGAFDLAFFLKVIGALAPPLVLIVLVLGSIIGGYATVNDAGAVGAAGALAMASYKLAEGRRDAYWPALLALASAFGLLWVKATFDISILNIDSRADQLGAALTVLFSLSLLGALAWAALRVYAIDDTLNDVMLETAKTSSLVFIILLGAALLTAAFRAFGGERLVEENLSALPGGFWAQFFVVMAVIFLLGFFLDFIEIAVVVVPIVAPILLADPSANVTAVWFGVMVGLNIQTSFLTPPFGFALFYLRGVASAQVKTLEIYRGVIPFIGLQLLALVIVAGYPALVNYLPQRVTLTAETAPPPKNPRLRYCLERFIGEEFAARGDDIRRSIATVRAADLSALPPKQRAALENAFDRAEASFAAHAAIGAAEEARLAAAEEHRPLHSRVRALQRAIRHEEAEIDALRKKARLALDDAARDDLAARADALEALIKEQRADIPPEWETASAAYRRLADAEEKARKTFRVGVDKSTEPVREMVEILASVDALGSFAAPLTAAKAALTLSDPKEGAKRLRALRREMRSAPEVGRIRSELNRAARALAARSPDPDKARRSYDKAVALFEAELAWRRRAASALLPSLKTYLDATSDSIGLRSLDRIPQRQALYLAACQANHRDLSLSF